MEIDISQRLKEGSLTRRQLLSLLWWGSAAVLAGEATAATIASLWPQTKAGSFGSKITAGKIGDFPVGSVTYFKEGRFFLSRVESGFLALYRKCTHLGCAVPWRDDESSEDDLVAKGRFNCPCHASIFNRYGMVKGGPAPRPLDIFPVAIKDEQVIVDTGTVIQRASFEESQVARI